MSIDAHQHFWRFDPVRDAWISEQMSVIRRDFLPADLKLLLAENAIEGCVAVQADQSEAETQFLLELAAQHEFIRGVVGWVDLQSKSLPDRLDYFSGFSKLKGFRHILQGEKPVYMLQPNFENGVRELGKRGYTYDILVFPRHLPAVRKFLKRLDSQFFIVDHLAKPYIKRGLIRQWEADMRRIARHENVYCKISGMVTEADWNDWTADHLRPYFEVALEAFGAERLVYGSDWPVCLLAASYRWQLEVVLGFVGTLSETEQAKIMGLNAAQFYRLDGLPII